MAASGKTWRASAETVPVRCPTDGCELRGEAAKNAVQDDTPHRFRATCPEHDRPLVEVKAKVKK